MTINNRTFERELKAAGLLGLSISWGEDGVHHQGLTEDQITTLNRVVADHNPDTIDIESRVLAIKDEAQRRINALFDATDLQSSLIKQMNAQKRATQLLQRQVIGPALSTEEEEEVTYLSQLGEAVDAIRDASDELETSLPENYTDDQHWPSATT